MNTRRCIKIKFVGYEWEGFNPEELYLYQMLEQLYDIELSDEPDYIICTIFGEKYQYCRFPQVRIMYEGENYAPDFNLVDYAISRYKIDYADRHFFLPGCADDMNGHWLALGKKNRDYSDGILAEKNMFCNMIASHDSEFELRSKVCEKLSEYRKVECPGRLMHNVSDDIKVSIRDDSKVDFQRKCKFTICFESTAHEDFCTEKIVDAFYADTIPIYYGSRTISEIFNPKAFINFADYDDIGAMIKDIIDLDQNDEKYMKMLREPIFIDVEYQHKLEQRFKDFLTNIFEQPLEKAYRRSRVYWPKEYEDYCLAAKLPIERIPIKVRIHTIVQNIYFKLYKVYDGIRRQWRKLK